METLWITYLNEEKAINCEMTQVAEKELDKLNRLLSLHKANERRMMCKLDLVSLKEYEKNQEEARKIALEEERKREMRRWIITCVVLGLQLIVSVLLMVSAMQN